MSRLQTLSDYERELTRLDEMVESAKALGINDVATRLNLASLAGRRAALASQLAELSDEQLPGQELDLVFEGRPVVGHKIESEFMGEILQRVQHLIRAIADSERPDPRNAGPFRANIRKATTLHFAGAFSGSFGMRLEAIQEQPTLDGWLPLAPTLRTVMELVGSGDRPEEVLDHLALLGPRARRSYREFVEQLGEAHADLRVRWPNRSGPREARLRPRQAARLAQTLGQVRSHVDGRYYLGVLDGASRRHGRFEFASNEGEQFAGVVEPEILDDLKRFYDRPCRAYILTRELEHPRTGVVRRAFRLQELLRPEARGSLEEGARPEEEFTPRRPE